LNGGRTFAVDYLNEYTTFYGAPMSYDNDVDVLTYNGWTYTYDAQNRLVSAALNGTTIATFYYDGLNRQIARSINGVITFSVWDGDWAVLEEYGTSNTITQKYLQGYHGLVKTLQDNIYYYQDELGSTSHIATSSGALLEYYKYDLYGKPNYWSAANSQLPTSNYNVHDLGDGGARWIPELGLYDDRNRFMSPDLGRFLQPDPIGFKGDASNLYRYVGNDWANKTDPMGLVALASGDVNLVDPKEMRALQHLQAILNLRLSLGYGATQLAGLYNAINHLSNQNLQFGPVSATQKGASPLNPSTVKTGIDMLKQAISDSDVTQYVGYTMLRDPQGHLHGPYKSVSFQAPDGSFKEKSLGKFSANWTVVVNAHVHPPGHWTWSDVDRFLANEGPVFRNQDRMDVRRGGRPDGFAEALFKASQHTFDANGVEVVR
jgi:RHS repeat-associated protein